MATTRKDAPPERRPARPKLKSSHERVPSREGPAPTPRARPGARRSVRPAPPAPSPPPAGPPPRAPAPGGPPSSRTGDRAPRSKRPKKDVAATPGQSLASDASRELAIAIAIAALEKKAAGLEILDVAGKVDYADFLVLMTGRSDRQVASLSQAIEEALSKKGKRPLSVEGLPHATWVLMDFGDVVVHVFQEGARSTYDIEGLWMDARRIPVPLPA